MPNFLSGFFSATRRAAFVHRALRVALSSYVTNGLSAATGLLVISTLAHLMLGPEGAAAATVGVIVVTPPDMPAPRHGKFTHLLPAALIGTPLFFVTLLLHQSVVELWMLLVGFTFIAFLGAAWGKRGLPISISVMLSLVFALAAPPPMNMNDALIQTLSFAFGAMLYLLWGTLANGVLNPRYRTLVLVDSLLAVAGLMRTQALQFHAVARGETTDFTGLLMKQQAALADELQSGRNILLESPRTPRRMRLAGTLLQVLDMRDHLVACSLDLDALRAVPGQEEFLATLGGEIEALAADIDSLAEALLLWRPPAPHMRARPALAQTAADLAATPGALAHSPPPQLLAGALARRVGYVHDEVARVFAIARGEREPDVDVVRVAWKMFVSPTTWSWRPFLSLWRWDAPPLRHAIRAALAIGAGQIIAVALPWGSHDYWILLTIVVVLRGSLAQTLERRNSRVAGTVLGCLLASALLYSHASTLVFLMAVTFAQAIAHAFAIRRYLITAIAATVLALAQAHLLGAGISPVFEVAERLADTAIGVMLAWAFSYVLPSWERTQVASLVKRTLTAQARHAQLALGLGQLDAVDDEAELAWRLSRREAYDSLSALVQAVQRSLSEPRAVRPRLEDLERMLGHGYQLLAQLTAIKTMLLQRRDKLDIERLQGPLQHTSKVVVDILSLANDVQPTAPTPTAARAATDDGARPMLESVDIVERDLTPWLMRRLALSAGIARELREDAQRALLPVETVGELTAARSSLP